MCAWYTCIYLLSLPCHFYVVERRHSIELTLFIAGLIATATAWIIKEFIFRPLQEQLYKSERSIRELSSNIKELTECITDMKVSIARLAMELDEVKRRVDRIEDTPRKTA